MSQQKNLHLFKEQVRYAQKKDLPDLAKKLSNAIAFFEGSPQDKEFENLSSELKEVIKKAKITVFRFEKEGEKAYRICKLKYTGEHIK